MSMNLLDGEGVLKADKNYGYNENYEYMDKKLSIWKTLQDFGSGIVDQLPHYVGRSFVVDCNTYDEGYLQKKPL